MQLFAFGVNHETAPLDVCESFAFDAEAQARLYEDGAVAPEAEFVLLSTCNRTEVYGYGTRADARAIQDALAQHAGRSWPAAEAFSDVDEPAVRHVLQVTAGMRSMVPGDAQILAQMKEAYRRADDAGRVDMALHRLMHTAFRAAKRVVRETDLASGAASVSTAAVAMARDHFGGRTPAGLDGRTVLLVGAGQMGRLALGALRSHRPARIRVTNRSAPRARALAQHFQGDVVPWAERHTAAAAADLVLVATGADAPVLRDEALPPRAAAEDAVLIDIAMPRNVDPAVADRDGYVVRDLSALKAWTRRVEAARREALPTAQQICEELLGEYVSWVFHQEALQPAIQAIRETFDAVRRQEVDRHAHRFTDADRDELDRLTNSILQKILAVPIVRLKDVGPDSISYVRGIRLLSALFARPGCEDAGAPGASSEADAEAPEAAPICPFGGGPAPSAQDLERIRTALDLSGSHAEADERS